VATRWWKNLTICLFDRIHERNDRTDERTDKQTDRRTPHDAKSKQFTELCLHTDQKWRGDDDEQVSLLSQKGLAMLHVCRVSFNSTIQSWNRVTSHRVSNYGRVGSRVIITIIIISCARTHQNENLSKFSFWLDRVVHSEIYHGKNPQVKNRMIYHLFWGVEFAPDIIATFCWCKKAQSSADAVTAAVIGLTEDSFGLK